MSDYNNDLLHRLSAHDIDNRNLNDVVAYQKERLAALERRIRELEKEKEKANEKRDS